MKKDSLHRSPTFHFLIGSDSIYLSVALPSPIPVRPFLSLTPFGNIQPVLFFPRSFSSPCMKRKFAAHGKSMPSVFARRLQLALSFSYSFSLQSLLSHFLPSYVENPQSWWNLPLTVGTAGGIFFAVGTAAPTLWFFILRR